MNSVQVEPIGNSVTVQAVGNSVSTKLFNVESEWHFITQFMPIQHHEKVSERNDNN